MIFGFFDFYIEFVKLVRTPIGLCVCVGIICFLCIMIYILTRH
jgi:hypothetical protein